jgi:cyanate permease
VLSLGPSLLSKLLHITSPLLAGGTACVMFLTATGLQFVVKNLSIRSIFLIGAGSTLLAMISVATTVHTSQPAWLIAAAVFAGAGQGLGQLGGLTLIGMHVEAHRRAEANAVMNIGGYIPAGLLPVATGFLIDKIGLSGGATMFAAILAAVSIFAAVLVFKGLSRD